MNLPLPVATLVRRAKNAKGLKERHDTAYFSWEASVRLAVAAQPPVDAAALRRPSMGNWVGAMPAGEERHSNGALLAVYGLATEVGKGRRVSPKTVTSRRLVDALPAYRNEVIAHGSTRKPEFYEHAAMVLLAGIEVAWAAGVFWERDARLVYVEAVAEDPDAEHRARIVELSGLAGRLESFAGTESVPEHLVPRRLYVHTGGAYRPLHPWLLYREAELREGVLFYNRPSGYLDYVSGETSRAKELAPLIPTLAEDLVALFGEAREPKEEPGEQDPNVFGDYQVLGKLGEGGMGVVYLARQESLGRLVAVKMLPPAAAADAIAVARFRREVAALSRCEHPNVVKVLAAGEARGTHYYAMELVEGADLAQIGNALSSTDDVDAAISTASEEMRRARPEVFEHVPQLPLPRGAEPVSGAGGRARARRLAVLFRDAALAVGHLHEMGVLHRDLKPSNLMVTSGEHRVVVMDLGLAALGDASRSITRDRSALLGTLRYMPPEQLQRNLLKLDRRADVYALGATFYELLTGRAFFDGDSEARLVEQVLREEPVHPAKANPALPADLATIVKKATEKDPKLRYDTADDLAEDIDAFLEGRPIAARPPTLGYVLKLAVKRHTALAATLVAALVVVVAATGVFLARERGLRRDAEVAQAAAEEAVADLYAEQGRQEMLAGKPRRALAYLGEAYRMGADTTALRFLLAQAALEVERKQVTLEGHEDQVYRAKFSPNGSRVLTASRDKTAKIWDAATGEPLVSLEGHTHAVRMASFDRTGTRVVTASYGETAQLWDVASGRRLESLEGHTNAVHSASFDPTGTRVVTASYDKTARVWHAATGKLLALFDGHTDHVNAASFSPDGALVLTASEDGAAKIWEATTGKLVASLEGHEDRVDSASFSPDGERVVTIAYKSVKVWQDLTTPPLSLEGHSGIVRCASFSPDSTRIVTAGSEETAKVWDAATGELLFKLGGHTREIQGASFSPNGEYVVTASEDGTAKIWFSRTGGLLASLAGHSDTVWSASFSPDGARIVTASEDGTAKLWDVAGGGLHASLGHRFDSPDAYAFRQGGSHVVTAEKDKTKVWDASGGKLLSSVEGYDEWAIHVWLSPNGARMITAHLGDENNAKLWRTTNGKLIAPLDGHPDEIRSAWFSPDNTHVVTIGGYKGAKVWDVATGKLLASLDEGSGRLDSVAFSPDGAHIATTGFPSIRIWDASTRKRVAELASCTHGLQTASFSSDGARLASPACAGTNDAAVFDVATGRILTTLDGHTHEVWGASFSPDGTRIVSASADTTAKIWDAETGDLLASLDGHKRRVDQALFSPDSALVVTASTDRTAKIWDAETGKLLASLGGHSSRIRAASFSPDGTRVVTRSLDASNLWDVHLETRTPAQITELVRRRVSWRLERGQLLPTRPGVDPEIETHELDDEPVTP